MQAIALSRDQAGATAQTVYDLLLLGRDNPVAHLDMGTPETVPGLTVEDARAFYDARYSPSIASLVVVSDLDEAELLPKLAALEGVAGPRRRARPARAVPRHRRDPPVPRRQAGRRAVGDPHRPARPRLRRHRRGTNRAGLANFALGGAFNSRINLNLREDKGYTYGARSGFRGNRDYGTFTASAAVRTDATAASHRRARERDPRLRGRGHRPRRARLHPQRHRPARRPELRDPVPEARLPVPHPDLRPRRRLRGSAERDPRRDLRRGAETPSPRSTWPWTTWSSWWSATGRRSRASSRAWATRSCCSARTESRSTAGA